ncbi:MAG TPA: hypothetical protein VGC22_12480 [Chitinophaga sp.]
MIKRLCLCVALLAATFTLQACELRPPFKVLALLSPAADRQPLLVKNAVRWAAEK